MIAWKVLRMYTAEALSICSVILPRERSVIVFGPPVDRGVGKSPSCIPNIVFDIHIRKLWLDTVLAYAYTIVIDNVIEKGEEEHYGRCGYVAEIGCRRER